MVNFAEYYVNFLWEWLQNVWYFISEFFILFYKLFIGDVIGYDHNGIVEEGYIVTLGKAISALTFWVGYVLSSFP